MRQLKHGRILWVPACSCVTALAIVKPAAAHVVPFGTLEPKGLVRWDSYPSFDASNLRSPARSAVAEWGVYRQEQLTHGEPTKIADYLVQFGQSTLENWQSEFLQLFAFVVFSAVLIHRGSAESKDSDDRVERKIDAIARQLEELKQEGASVR